MIALRRIENGQPSTTVEVVPDFVARVLLEKHEAIPANQTPPPESVVDTVADRHIDDALEVVGLTDRDPAFFEEQARREKEEKARKALDGPPQDRMQRGGRRK